LVDAAIGRASHLHLHEIGALGTRLWSESNARIGLGDYPE
jgi:hypothetical protein